LLVLYGNGNHSGRQHLRPDRRRGWPCRGLRPAVMALTVASYAELSTRFPVSAGEAAYVRAAFQSRALATAIGLLTVVTSVVSSGAVTLGSASYIQQFMPPLNAVALSGIGFGSLLAFFAFIGVEDLANVVGEAKVPHRDIPRAMVLTGQRLGHPYRDSRLVLSTTSGRR
jgi:amino acid transporter